MFVMPVAVRGMMFTGRCVRGKKDADDGESVWINEAIGRFGHIRSTVDAKIDINRPNTVV